MSQTLTIHNLLTHCSQFHRFLSHCPAVCILLLNEVTSASDGPEPVKIYTSISRSLKCWSSPLQQVNMIPSLEQENQITSLDSMQLFQSSVSKGVVLFKLSDQFLYSHYFHLTHKRILIKTKSECSRGHVVFSMPLWMACMKRRLIGDCFVCAI